MHTIVVFDIDGVVRDVAQSYRRAIADTVEHFTENAWRPTMADIDKLKAEGIWNNDWEASRELIYRFSQIEVDYEELVNFFQSRYRGSNANKWDGYITTESLLMQANYLANLTANNIGWGFFSGATRGSAEYVLKGRLGLENPVLIAMEDAPSKPNPTGLIEAVKLIEDNNVCVPVIYVGDTVADMYTAIKAREMQPQRIWFGVGVLPPHVQTTAEVRESYTAKLQEAGAIIVLSNVEQLNPEQIIQIISQK